MERVRGSSSGLRVLAIAPTSFFADYGCHVRILQQALALQARGHEVRLLTYPTGEDIPHVSISRARGWWGLRDLQIGPNPAKVPLDVSLLSHSLAYARRWRPDVVCGYLHEGAFIGSVVSSRVGAPLVFDYQGSLAGELAGRGWLRQGRLLYRLIRRVERRIHHRASAMMCSSRHAVEALEAEGDCPRVVALPDCVDTSLFDPARFSKRGKAELSQRLAIPPDRKVIAYLGLLGEHQGISHLLRAAAAWPADAPPAHFLLMGYPRLDAYRKLAVQSGVADRITFTGKVHYEDAPLYLSLGDVAAAPKVSDTEGHGKLLNYMAMRLPTVAFDTPVSREYLAEWGRYAPLGDTEALAHCLAELAGSADGNALGEALRRRAEERFSCDAMGAALESVLLSVAQPAAFQNPVA
jgi:glycosyltransferase involved in cell wall biosynthesis